MKCPPRDTHVPYRLVFADIDGTLVDGAGEMSARVKLALCRLREIGIPLVLCTGRSRHAAHRIANELGGKGFGIVLNGAVVLDWETDTVLHSSLLPASTVRPASDIAHIHHMAAIWLGVEDRENYSYSERGTPLWPAYEQRNGARIRVVDDFASLPTAPASLAAYGTEQQTVRLLRAWVEEFGASVAATAGPTPAYDAWYAQLTTSEADKGFAAALLAHRLGVPAKQTLAIGDHHNDVGLLRWSGLGICMGDGHPGARAAADYITGTLAEDGAARALERFVLDGS